MDAALYPSALESLASQGTDLDPAGQILQPLDALADQSPNLAKWRSVVVDGRVVPSYVLIGPRTGRVPIRLGLLGGTRSSDVLSTISIVKLLVELDLEELTVDELDGVIAVQANQPIAGFQIQVSSRVIATEVLWRALELPQKLVPLANEPIQPFPQTESTKHSFANLGHLRPRPFSLIIRSPKNTPSEKQISAIAFSIEQILLHYRSLVRQADRM